MVHVTEFSQLWSNLDFRPVLASCSGGTLIASLVALAMCQLSRAELEMDAP